MARKTVLVSVLSGKEIAEGKGAHVTIRFSDARKGTIVLDVTDDEGEERGRREGSRRVGVVVRRRSSELLSKN